MGQAATAPAGATGRHQRRLKNLLLDRHFQLKYTGYLVGVALVLSLGLGAFLWRASETILDLSEETVALGNQSIKLGQSVIAEHRKVTKVVQMNIVKDPFYKENPALLAAFEGDAKKQEEELNGRQADLQGKSEALVAQSSRLEQIRKTFSIVLTAALLILVLGLGLAGIVITHKVAGPIYKARRLIRELGDGRLIVPPPLRKGDELVDFFKDYNETVHKLRDRQKVEIEMLDSAIAKLKETGADLTVLQDLRKHMQVELD